MGSLIALFLHISLCLCGESSSLILYALAVQILQKLPHAERLVRRALSLRQIRDHALHAQKLSVH
jgi:hypothetical protein